MVARLVFLGAKRETLLNDRDLLKFDLTFQIGRISRAELKALAGNDRTRRDRAKRQIAERILARLCKTYDFSRKAPPAPVHSTSLRQNDRNTK